MSIRLDRVHQTDLLAADGIPVRLRRRGGRPVRVGVTASLRLRGGRLTVLGSIGKLRLSRRRARLVEVPLRDAARVLLAGCEGRRIGIRVRNRRSSRARSRSTRLRLDAPNCARFFGATTFWNSPLPPDAPLDPDSSNVAAELQDQVRDGFRSEFPPTINTTSYAPPIYTVSRDQPRVRVHLDRPPGYAPDLEAAFASVPLPPAASPSAGSDAELVVWQPATDTLWEFWQLRRSDDGWHASWGGRMREVSTGQGVFSRPHANWGTSASSLPLAGGLITPGELRRGEIDHALALGIPRVRADEFARPAQRTDGRSTCPHAVPEGAHFRLDPGLDIDALGLAPPVAALARAAQRYGIIVRDRARAVVFYAQNPSTLATDPYPAILGGRSPSELLASFPWSHLRLLRMDLVKTPGSSRERLLLGCT